MIKKTSPLILLALITGCSEERKEVAPVEKKEPIKWEEKQLVEMRNVILEPAPTKIMKCTDETGKITYSNIKCAGKTKVEEVKAEANVIDSGELRAWAARNPHQPTYTQQTAETSAQQFSAIDCENAKRSYEFERGYKYGKAIDEKRRDVYRACGYWP